MELTAAHAMQFLMLVGTIAGGYAVVKSQLSRVMEDLEQHIQKAEDNRSKFDARLDDAESERMLFAGQIETLKGINSAPELKILNRELSDIGARLKMVEKHIDKIQDLHIYRHPTSAGQ